MLAVSERIKQRYAECAAKNRPALVTFVTAGDPDLETATAILHRLPSAGADVIELGMPFSDPMAEGPPIQASSKRALEAGHTMKKTLDMVSGFRKVDDQTPIVLMGYYNPVYSYGTEAFIADALKAGVDGMIIVDLPPEADDEFCIPALRAGLNFIRLATPTTDEKRLPMVLRNTSGFVYYVSINGITGTASPDTGAVAEAVSRIKDHTDLPVAVGFGVKTPNQAAAIGRTADGVVVGSAIVNTIRDSLDAEGKATDMTVDAVAELVSALSGGVRASRQMAAE